MIYAISQIKFTIELNPKFIGTGFFVAKNVGILFLNIIIIRMEEQESQNNKLYIFHIYKKYSNNEKLEILQNRQNS